jgi:hypothetical protein
MQAMGLRTHAWNTAWRSMLLLAGFPLLLAIMALGIGMIFGAEQRDLGRAFGNALRNLPGLYVMAWGVAIIWFAIAWAAHDRILDWATGAHAAVEPAREPVHLARDAYAAPGGDRDAGAQRLCRGPVAGKRVGHRHARADERPRRPRAGGGAGA